jgi:hypothetical protein
MASKITIKRSTAALPPAGLSFGELAFVQGTGLTANQLYVGLTGASPVWVGAQISTTGSWTDTAARTSLATQYAIDQRISSQISGSNVITTADDNSNATKYLVFTSGAGAGVTLGVDTATNALIYNPSTNELQLKGDLHLYSGDIRSSKTVADIFPSVVRTLNMGLSAGITMGSTTGSSRIRNPTLILGSTGSVITSNDGTANSISITPYGNLQLQPNTTSASVGGTKTSLVVTNTVDGAGQVQIVGGDLALGTKSTTGFDELPVNIIFEGTTNDANKTTLGVIDPTANRTILLPNASDTLVGKATIDTFTNKTFDTAGSGNVFRINGVTLTANTGTGSNVLATSPTLVTPTLGVASATTINKVTITAPATGSTITVADGKTLTASNTLTFTGTDAASVAFGAGGTVLYTGNLGTNVGTFLATPSSANLISAVTDETGTGSLVFGTSPTITTSLLTGSSSFDLLNTTATTINFAGGASTALNIGNASSNATFAGNVVVNGNLTVQGDTTTLNTTTLNVEDFNITMGLTLNSASLCTGAGIGIGVGTGITFAYNHATSQGWQSSVNIDLATGKVYEIGGTSVLSSSALGSGVTGSSLTQVGTITSGVWNGTAITDGNLATISTAGKVLNSATTATDANTASAIVARDASGNFTATTITAALTGNASTATSAMSATNATNATNIGITTENSDVESYITFVLDNSSGNKPVKVSQQLKFNSLTGELSATLIDGGSF